MICQRCLQGFESDRYGHGTTICPVCADELADEDKNREERDEAPTHDVSRRWDGGLHNRPGTEHNPEGNQ